jgi:hypothetical protein
MPFETSFRLVLRNDTPYDLLNYSYVEGRRLPRWDPSLGYLHAAWRRFALQLTPDTDVVFHRIEGHGHLIGRAWSVCTDDPLLEGFHFIMEGNNEVYIDEEPQPRADYLGSEDSFGFAWGWPQRHDGIRSGINYVHHQLPSQLSTYRFSTADAIPFSRSLEWRVDWSHEFPNNPWLGSLRARNANGGGWVDYALTHYWYQETVGHDHGSELPLADRIRPVLHPNPPLG